MIAQANFLVPLRARELGASFDVIGLIVGAGALAAVFASVPCGALIDRFGPRRTFLVGTAGSTLLSLLYPLVTDYWWFLVLQPALGVARNLGWMSSQGYIMSIGTEKERPTLSGRFSLVGNLGQMAGPVLVGVASGAVGFRWALFVPAAYGLVFTALALVLPETRKRSDAAPARQGAGLRSAWSLLAIRGVRVVILLTFARLWMMTVYTTFLPVYLVGRGFDPGLTGAVVSTSSLLAAAGAGTAGFWTRYGSPRAVSILVLFGGVAGLLLAPHLTALPWVFVVPALVGTGAGISWPLLLTLVTTEAPQDKRGVALGLRGMAAQGGMSSAPLLVGPLVALLGMALGFTVAGCAAATMLLGAGLLTRRSRECPS